MRLVQNLRRAVAIVGITMLLVMIWNFTTLDSASAFDCVGTPTSTTSFDVNFDTTTCTITDARADRRDYKIEVSDTQVDVDEYRVKFATCDLSRPSFAGTILGGARDPDCISDLGLPSLFGYTQVDGSYEITYELTSGAGAPDGGGVTYTLNVKWTVTASNIGAITATVFGGGFGAAPTATTTEQAQQQAAGNLVQNRNQLIQNLQPNIGGFIDGTFANGGGDLGQFALRGNEAGFNMAFASSLGRVLSSQAKNEALARRQIAQDRANNALIGSSQTSAFLYGESVPSDADGVTQTSATIKKPGGSGESSETDALELNAEEKVYGSSAGAQEVENTSQLDQARERGYDMWAQIYGAKAHSGNSDSTLWVGYAGAHKFINDNLIIGGLVQLDWVDESNDTAGSSADGFGWMVGPYIAAKLPDQNLFFDARAAYGRSDNDITLTTSTGSFQTERWLVSAKVSGLLEQGDIEIRPAVGFSYFEETQESYTDSTNTVIGSQTFTQGEIRFGPTFAKTYYQNDGTTLKPRIGINGVWNFSVDNGASTTAVLDNGDLRARLDIGVTILGTEKWFVDLSGFYDGIGINNYYAYGGKARLTVPLN